MKAFDGSRYSFGNVVVPVPVLEELHRPVANHGYGCDLAIIGSWHGGSEGYDAAEQTLVNCRVVGLLTATYIALSPSMSGRESVDEGRRRCGNEWGLLKFVAVDAETIGVTAAHVRDAVQAILEYGGTPVVYTAHYIWRQMMGDDSTEFSGLPLWNAYYDDDPDIDYQKLPYGGWTIAKLAGEQYTNTTDIAGGVAVDFSVFSDEWILSLTQGIPDTDFAGTVKALREAWGKDMADLAVNAADLIQTPFDTTRLALHDLYTQNRDGAWKRFLNPVGGK